MSAHLGSLLIGAGILLCAAGYALMSNFRRSALRELLNQEVLTPTRSPKDLSDLMERAGAFTERALGGTESAGRLKVKLIQAGSPMRAGEFAAITAAAALVLGLIVLMASGSPMLAIAAPPAVVVVAMVRLNRRARKRMQRMESQLPEVLQLIAGALDSGTSLLVAMELAGEEGEEPLASELGRVVLESGVGRPLLEALDAMAERTGSRDIMWTVKAIRIQHQTGGKLADTLRVLAEFMGARQEVRGEIRALSAEAKISGRVLIALPLVLGSVFYVFRGSYMEPLFTTGIGRLMLGAAAAGMIFGYLWMRKLGNVDM